MKRRVRLTNWQNEGKKVRLYYEDGDSFCIGTDDFNRAFTCFLNSDKAAIKRDFCVSFQ